MKYDACCAASLPPGVPAVACSMTMTCSSVMGPGREQLAEICRQSLAAFASEPDAPAVCK